MKAYNTLENKYNVSKFKDIYNKKTYSFSNVCTFLLLKLYNKE